MKLTALTVSLLLIQCLLSEATVVRNSELINKMITDFQKDNGISLTLPDPEEIREEKPTKVLALMQNVLCRNFPAIPCNMITNDNTLKRLIEKSIKQINKKKYLVPKNQQQQQDIRKPNQPANSEDVSDFAKVYKHESYTHVNNKPCNKGVCKKHKQRKYWSREEKHERQANEDRASMRKKMKKYYPHKVKYKDKHERNRQMDRDEQSGSAERKEKGERGDKGFHGDNEVWHVNYGAHGEAKSSRNRNKKDRTNVLHTDLFIKKNLRRNSVDLNSAGIE